MSFCSESDQIHNLSFNLRYEIYPVECSYKILSTKVEVKLKKKEGVWWDTFDRKELTGKALTNINYFHFFYCQLVSIQD